MADGVGGDVDGGIVQSVCERLHLVQNVTCFSSNTFKNVFGDPYQAPARCFCHVAALEIVLAITQVLAHDTRNVAHVVNALLTGSRAMLTEAGDAFGLGRVDTAVHLSAGSAPSGRSMRALPVPGAHYPETTGPGGIVDLNHHDVRHLQVLSVTPGRWMRARPRLDLWSRAARPECRYGCAWHGHAVCVDDESDDSVSLRRAREVFGLSAVVSVE